MGRQRAGSLFEIWDLGGSFLLLTSLGVNCQLRSRLIREGGAGSWGVGVGLGLHSGGFIYSQPKLVLGVVHACP